MDRLEVYNGIFRWEFYGHVMWAVLKLAHEPGQIRPAEIYYRFSWN